MKKARVLLVAVLFALGFAVNASAIVLEVGTFGMKFSGLSYSDFDYDTIFGGGSGLPSHPLQIAGSESGNVWGMFALTSVHSLTDDNPENGILDIPAYYNPGSDGKYYYGVYGGLTYMSDTGSVPGAIRLTQTASGSYLKIYEVNAANLNAYSLDAAAGPNVAGGGALGTFGANIIANGTLWLDTVFSPGTLAYYDSAYQAGELELINLSSATTGSAEGYLDIIGGTAMPLFETGVFPLAFPGAPNDADLKVISDLTALYNPASGWTSKWVNSMEDPITGAVVPEPSTLLLLGAGLVGLVGLGCRRKQ